MAKRSRSESYYGDSDSLHPDDSYGGSNFNDHILAYLGSDSVNGGNGNDYIEGGYGDDHIEGGNGKDTLYGDNFTEYTGTVTDPLLQTSDDYLDGGNGNDMLYGQEGDDDLWGGNGKDMLYGGDGDDTLHGGTGKDVLDGGDGFDTVSYEDATSRVTVNLETGVSSGKSEGKDTLISIENIIGSSFDDTLTGNDADNVLVGGGGNDTLSGGAGNDVLIGGGSSDDSDEAEEDENEEDDDDSSSGGAVSTDNDILNGGDGDDILIGGAGIDTLTGGAGIDTFVFDSLDAMDIVTDFVSGTDKLAFDDDAFLSLSELAFGTGNFVAGPAALDADDFLVYDSATGVLYYDADGSGAGAAVGVAQFTAGTTIAYTDILTDA